MEIRANYTLVGTFVIFFLAMIVAFVIWITSIGTARNTTQYDIYFSRSVTGLKEGSTVLYRGVPVGTVDIIKLDPHNIETVRTTISIKNGVPIKDDTYASLEIQGITGASYIQLNGGTTAAHQLLPQKEHKRAVIKTKSSVFEEVTASLPAVLQQMSKILDEVRSLFSEEVKTDLAESLRNIRAITKSLTPIPGKEDYFHKFILSFQDSLQDVRAAAIEMKSLIKENRYNLQDFTRTGLPAFTQFLSEGQEALTAIRRLTESLERSPSRFIYNDPKQGVRVP